MKRPRALKCLALLLCLGGCDDTLPACGDRLGVEAFATQAEAGLLQLTWGDKKPRHAVSLTGDWQNLTLGGGDGEGGLWALSLAEGQCLARAWTAAVPESVRVAEYLALPNGELLVGGTLMTGGDSLPEDLEAWVARYDHQGALVWQRSFGSFLFVSDLLETPSHETVQSLTQLPDGSFAVAGLSSVNAALHSNWLLLLDAAGNERQRIDLPRDNPRQSGSLDALLAPDRDSWLLAGTLAGPEDSDLWLLRYADTDLVWDRTIAASGSITLAAATRQAANWYLAGQQYGKAWLAAYGAEDSARWDLLASGGAGSSYFSAVASNKAMLAAGGQGQHAFALAVDTEGHRLWSFHEIGAAAYAAVLPDGDGWLLLGHSEEVILLRRLDRQGRSRDWRHASETN